MAGSRMLQICRVYVEIAILVKIRIAEPGGMPPFQMHPGVFVKGHRMYI